ncbi:MAG: hypothetical protein GY851_01855 [bacterium]|nr:hypothetical protein [bacterium]
MDGEYTDMTAVAKALGYSLCKHFDHAAGRLFLDPRNSSRPMEYVGTVRQLVTPFCAFCSKLKRAWVSYDPGHPYGMVAKVVGHCGCLQEDCERCCSRYYDRPRAILILTKVDDLELAIGGCLSTEEPNSSHHPTPLVPPLRSV